jgi:hypothetical protein
MSQRKAVARDRLLRLGRMTRSKKSRGGKKCSSEILGAYCDRTKMRLTGFVRGTGWFLMSSTVLGCSSSSVAPLRIDLRRGASWSCL